MKNQLKNYFKILTLFLGVSLLLWNCDSESVNMDENTIIEKTQTKNLVIDREKINFLKRGLNHKIRRYNKKHRRGNQFLRKYGKLDGKHAITIKFPQFDNNFMFVVPFKKKNNEKLLIAFYKNGKRTYKILKKKKYNKKNISTAEKSFLDNLNLLFELTSNSKNTIAKSGCFDYILFHDYVNCTIAYENSCTGLIRIVSSLGKDETCGGELDEVVVTGDGDSNDPDPYDPTDWNPPSGDEPADEDCFEYDCEEDGYGENNENVWTINTILFANPGQEITDIEKHLECFNASQSAILTIYVDQPVANSSDTWSGSTSSPDVGHTFISISQNGITRTLGFYPEGGIKPKISNNANGILVDDSEHPYDVSASRSISAGQLTSLLTSIESYGINYNLEHNNCSDFGLFMVNQRGFNFPDTSGNWPGGSGTNPGNLGQDIRNSSSTTGTTMDTTGGNSPQNSGTCP